MKKINLLLSIRSLDIGGAERQFIELVKHIDKTKFDVTVCTMYGGLQESIVVQIPNIHYINLEKKGRYDFFQFYLTYKKLLKEIQPDVIYSFLGEMNLFSLWCKPKNTKIIWGFRASDMDLSKYGIVSKILFFLQQKLSKFTNKIIANSKASVEFHTMKGFDMGRSVIIPNGINTKRFKKNEEARKEFRDQYHLADTDIAIGIVARLDPMKGYPIFAKMAKNLLHLHKNIYFFAIGSGEQNIQTECMDILTNSSVNYFHWLGSRNNIEDIYSGLDIAVSASLTEGFSNVIAEAMSCEVPCVVTDVGDSAQIIDDTGILCAPNDPESLLEAVQELLKQDLHTLGSNARHRIIKHYSIEMMISRTEKEIIQCVG